MKFKPLSIVNGGEAADAELVSQACHGPLAERQAAFSVLVTRYEGFVRALLMGLCRQAALADDLAQEAFLTAWEKLPTLQSNDRFRAWLRQLAYRQFLHHYRHGKVEAKYAHLEHKDEGVALEMTDDLESLLILCSPLERELMVLCYGFEFTYAEIAGARNMAVGTVKSHIHRAKLKMQAHLEHAEMTVTGAQGNSTDIEVNSNG